MSTTDEIKELLRIKKQRLHELEMKKARGGPIHTPADIVIEIKEIEEEIKKLYEELVSLIPDRQPGPKPSRNKFPSIAIILIFSVGAFVTGLVVMENFQSNPAPERTASPSLVIPVVEDISTPPASLTASPLPTILPTATPSSSTPASNTPTAPVPPTNTPILNCDGLATSSRPLQKMDTGSRCWFKLVDGVAAEITFNQSAQVTFRTIQGGIEKYLFYIASPGDKLTNLYGATIRSMSFVELAYGGIEEVRQFEADYHNSDGTFPICLRDLNNNNASLTDLCE